MGTIATSIATGEVLPAGRGPRGDVAERLIAGVFQGAYREGDRLVVQNLAEQLPRRIFRLADNLVGLAA
jgi:hypothetical protein